MYPMTNKLICFLLIRTLFLLRPFYPLRVIVTRLRVCESWCFVLEYKDNSIITNNQIYFIAKIRDRYRIDSSCLILLGAFLIGRFCQTKSLFSKGSLEPWSSHKKSHSFKWLVLRGHIVYRLISFWWSGRTVCYCPTTYGVTERPACLLSPWLSLSYYNIVFTLLQ